MFLTILFIRTTKACILDLRRANNVGIGLSRFYKRLDDEEILSALINGSNVDKPNDPENLSKWEKTFLNIDDLLTLKNCLPTKDEVDLLKIFKGDISSLNRAEKFMLIVAKEPYAQWMVDALIYERQFPGEIESIKDKLETFTGILSKIRESPNLKVLLRTVLELGNLANYDYGKHAGTMSFSKGRALGFSMDSLVKLQEVKSVDRSTTLVHYLVSVLESRHPEVLTLPIDFGTELGIAKHWDSSAIFGQLSELQSGFSKFYMQSFPMSKDTRVEEFCSNQENFLISAKSQLENISAIGQKLQLTWKNTAEYFGEDPADQKPENLLALFDQFFRHLSQAHQENKRKALLDAKRSNKTTSSLRRTQSALDFSRVTNAETNFKLASSSSYTSSNEELSQETISAQSEADTLSVSDANIVTYDSSIDNADKAD